MRKAFSNPAMEIKKFSKEILTTASGEIKMTNKDSVTKEFNEVTKGKSVTVSEYNLSWD